MGFQAGVSEGQAQGTAPGRFVPQESLERGDRQQGEQRHLDAKIVSNPSATIHQLWPLTSKSFLRNLFPYLEQWS